MALGSVRDKGHQDLSAFRVSSVNRERYIYIFLIGGNDSKRIVLSLRWEQQVKCDRGHPRCGWCLRNNATCEYRERKKPGLRAGKLFLLCSTI